MSARDVLAASLWLIDREIAGAPLPHPSWETFRENDPETAMIYETQAGCHLAALSAAGWVVEQGWRTMETAPRDGTRFIAWFPPCVQLPAGGWHECQWHNGAWYHPFFVEPMLWRPGPSLPAAPEARDDGR